MLYFTLAFVLKEYLKNVPSQRSNDFFIDSWLIFYAFVLVNNILFENYFFYLQLTKSLFYALLICVFFPSKDLFSKLFL